MLEYHLHPYAILMKAEMYTEGKDICEYRGIDQRIMYMVVSKAVGYVIVDYQKAGPGGAAG
jgi:hypothetical protein